MAEPENKTAGEKVEAKGKHWFEVLRNRIVKLPFIRRFKVGRREPPEAPHPLYIELEKGWLDLNKNLYDNRLVVVENRWPEQSNQLGFEDIDVVEVKGEGGKEKSVVKFAYPDGIVALYYDMGPYSDYHRIRIERDWFEHGTGIVTNKLPCIISQNEDEWKARGWEKRRVEYIFSKYMGKPWEAKYITEMKLNSGKVFHEENPELKEELYIFSKDGLEKLKEGIKAHNQQFNIEGLQQGTIPVEVRTRFTNMSSAVEELIKTIEKIESENLTSLNSLGGKLGVYDQKRKKLLEDLSPEGIKEFRIRFPHTYKVIKQVAFKEVEETIRGKTKKNLVFKYFEFKDVYAEELRELEGINGVGGIINRLKLERRNIIGEKDTIIASLRRMTANRSIFENEIENIFRANRVAILNILNSANDNQTKLEEIIKLLKHRDLAMDGLLNKKNKLIDIIRLDVFAVIQSPDPVNTKINNIKNLIINSLKRSAIIEAHIKQNSLAIKGSLEPVGLSEDANAERVKDKDEMYNDLLYSFKVGQPEVDDLIETFFTENRDIIEGVLDEILKKQKEKKKIDIEKYFDGIADMVVTTSKRNDNDVGLIKLLSEEVEAEKRQEENREEGWKRHEARKEEINNIENIQQIRNELRRKADNFYKRPEEVAPGLDEYGHPLEVADDGTVLIDKWWNEIAKNPWQIRTIAMKAGGDEVLKRHLGLAVTYNQEGPKITGTPTRTLRKVNDKELIGYIDLLDMSTMIFGYWDSVRDDIRDGRYHRHSKSIGDYVIESMGGYHEELKAPYFKDWIPGIKRFGWYLARRGVDPTSIFHLDAKGYIEATPFDFERDFNKHVPEDEDKVKRDYKMKLPDGVLADGKNFISGERKPTKYDPAFDRRAKGLPFIFWGNMYYWRWAGYANEWSENPYPHISTRGIALYLKHLAESDVYYFQEAEKILEGGRYDYGTRGQGMFPWNNPSSGKDVTGENSEN